MSEDSELQAIQQLLSALEPLDSDARGRVLDYVFQRLDLAPRESARSTADTSALSSAVAPSSAPVAPADSAQGTVVDIRTFAAQKQPKSQMEKTVFVAFYLSEVAPAPERKSELSGADLAKYQKQAGLGAPTNTRQSLFRARDAGYLESAGHGKYKLNAVGYNFVAHSLRAPAASPQPSGRRASGTTTRKRSNRRTPARKKSSRKTSGRKR